MFNATRVLLATVLATQLGCSAARQETALSRAAAVCPSIEIAEVAGSPSAGKSLPAANGATVAVLDPPIVTTKDTADARLGKAEGRDVLEIDLEEEASARLRAYSASHVGARLAFVVDGRVRQVGRVLDPIVGKGIIIDPGDSKESAALVSALRDGGCAAKR